MEERQKISVYHWRATQSVDQATPLCPYCDQLLGIRYGIWRINTDRDCWLCNDCGEFDEV